MSSVVKQPRGRRRPLKQQNITDFDKAVGLPPLKWESHDADAADEARSEAKLKTKSGDESAGGEAQEVIHESETLSGLEIPADVLVGLEDPTSEEYADAVALLQIYLAKQLGVAPSAINIDDIDIEELTAAARGPGSAAVS